MGFLLSEETILEKALAGLVARKPPA